MQMPRDAWVAIDERTWRYEDEGVRVFLLAGARQALLIDAGMKVKGLTALARQVTDLPLALLNTHADIDHIAADSEFEHIYLSPFELCHPEMRHRRSDTVCALWDADTLDLGDRTLEIVALPGHTPGSVAVLDRESGALFSGDPIQRNGRIFMFGPLRSLAAYIISLERLMRRSDEIGPIWPSHGDCPLTMDVVAALIEGARGIESGALGYTIDNVFGHRVRAFDVGVAVLLTDDIQ